mgnify:CR=1 FL=1
MFLERYAMKRGVATALTCACVSLAAPQAAQAYQIDCAILICLAGGWPGSTECNEARSVFISRITPWPVEPPLQIWNCPLGVAYRPSQGGYPLPLLHEIASTPRPSAPQPFAAVLEGLPAPRNKGAEMLELIADYADETGVADIDISGSEYDFVRSIRVYNVEYARQHETGGDDGDCRRSEKVRVGTYGVQGDFNWSGSSVASLPDAFEGLSGWGEICPRLYQRSVFIDWTDYQGNYDHEQVNY